MASSNLLCLHSKPGPVASRPPYVEAPAARITFHATIPFRVLSILRLPVHVQHLAYFQLPVGVKIRIVKVLSHARREMRES